ncbi:MAG: lysophospholipid acyltransferase family protein [Terrimicrobiaceae bacterium]
MTRERLLAIIGSTILRLLFLTLRLDFEDRTGFTKNILRSPVIMCFWHNRILGITLAFLRHYPGKTRKGVNVLTSASRDGEILAQLVGRFGMDAVRGSSSRRGSRALRELIELTENGCDIAITPDGPRGPRYSFGPGAISLAQLTAAPIAPVHAKFTRCLRMQTWDGFIIPLPFSKVSVTVDDPIHVPRELNDKEFEAARSRVENLLRNEAD